MWMVPERKDVASEVGSRGGRISVYLCPPIMLSSRVKCSPEMPYSKTRDMICEDDEDEFKMEDEEQSESESSDLAFVMDGDEVFDSDSDKSCFLDVIRDHMVQEGIYFKIMKNEPSRYTAKCEGTTRSCSHSPKLNMLLSWAANAYCEVNFHKFMESLKKESPVAYAWLQDVPIQHWCRHKFKPITKVPDNSTNFIESFNNVIDACRGNPIFSVCKELREKFTE
ncbi:hypothetical protein Cgig2_024598 [Carnegiea gigantea]|uniref:Transposase n=1 Tax=Carnegiea gigantea TaxID=171969 RepID=A0A9Q1KKC0_9CARY|nr:hypothetical protein Cgig2_024598 [Carnegiea gigantea]